MTNLNTEHEDNPRFTVEELLAEFGLTLDPAPSFPRISGAILTNIRSSAIRTSLGSSTRGSSHETPNRATAGTR